MKSDSSIPKLPCACASLRRASRTLTQQYEEALRPFGLRSSQFTLLQVLALAGGVTQGKLAEILAMDSTTLTRTLAIMSRSGWISKRHGEDRREWRFRLTPAGEAQLKHALPLWERVQTKLRNKLGTTRWDALQQLADEVTSALAEQ